MKKNIKIGDLVITDHESAFLLKQTKNYWYYLCRGQNCRVLKRKLWKKIDTQKASIKLGSTLKRRKNQPKNRTLDLHGTRHKDVDERVRKFLNWVDLPTRIVIGDSYKMLKLVKKVIAEYGWYVYHDPTNFGEILVLENNTTIDKVKLGNK